MMVLAHVGGWFMANNFTEKQIRITITLDSGGGRASRVTFSENAAEVVVRKQGMPELPTASVNVYGLTLAQMSNLTMLSFDAQSLRKNEIVVEAGTAGERLSTVFVGEITNSAPDFSAVPSPIMHFEAITTAYARLEPSKPVSVNGSQSADSLCEAFAKEANLKFVSGGCTASVHDCVINGDPIEKMKWVANTVGADLIIEDTEATLLPRDSSRGAAKEIALISPSTGEIGYPSFDQQGIRFTCFFRPELHLADLVRIKSALPRATGVWKIYSLQHELSARMTESGVWRTVGAATWISN